MKIFWLLFMFIESLFASPSVVIVGGGPAGLATAIEARLAGAHVTVVEKRSAYEREQTVFLIGHSLSLLAKWEVNPLGLGITEIGDKRIGFVQISELEKALLKRAQELGAVILQDRYLELSKEGRFAILEQQGAIPYDILIAADGTHSHVRHSLGIETALIGQGKAGSAFFPPEEGKALNPIDISQPIQHGASFVKKFQFPEISFIFLQSPDSATKEDFTALCKASGWDQQAELIAKDQALLLLDVDVYLQKARRFSLKEKKALLVGDAAGTASFFRGRGANYALETAEIAGHFIQTPDYKRFELEMETATEALIEDSAFLFLP